ncbi:hypothetical protein PL11201_180012 [Planktothrix sp. PCC 11201]|nr:hypothetical protein PL11201_180012 [Planktothrix sp. PCC 11201]
MFIGVSSLGAVEPVCDYKEKRNNQEIIALSGQSAAYLLLEWEIFNNKSYLFGIINV